MNSKSILTISILLIQLFINCGSSRYEDSETNQLIQDCTTNWFMEKSDHEKIWLQKEMLFNRAEIIRADISCVANSMLSKSLNVELSKYDVKELERIFEKKMDQSINDLHDWNLSRTEVVLFGEEQTEDIYKHNLNLNDIDFDPEEDSLKLKEYRNKWYRNAKVILRMAPPIQINQKTFVVYYEFGYHLMHFKGGYLGLLRNGESFDVISLGCEWVS